MSAHALQTIHHPVRTGNMTKKILIVDRESRRMPRDRYGKVISPCRGPGLQHSALSSITGTVSTWPKPHICCLARLSGRRHEGCACFFINTLKLPSKISLAATKSGSYPLLLLRSRPLSPVTQVVRACTSPRSPPLAVCFLRSESRRSAAGLHGSCLSAGYAGFWEGLLPL